MIEISWLGMMLGLVGPWLVGGGRKLGWTISALSQILWLGFDARQAIWAGAFGALATLTVYARNAHEARMKEARNG